MVLLDNKVCVGNIFPFGFSVIEVMIALALSSILIATAITTYISIKNVYNNQTNLMGLEENAQLASSILNKDIQTAGYGGCAKNNLLDGIHGYNSEDLPTYLKNKDIKPKTDVILIKKADTNVTYLTADVNKSTNTIKVEKNPTTSDNLWLFISDCTYAEVSGAESATSNTIKLNKNITHHYQKIDTEVAQYNEIAYFISVSSYTDESGRPIYSLYEVTNGNKDMMAHKVELIPYINDMQIQYGIDTNGDGVVDNYCNAKQVIDWEKVQSVNIQLELTNENHSIKKLEIYSAIRGRIV